MYESAVVSLGVFSSYVACVGYTVLPEYRLAFVIGMIVCMGSYLLTMRSVRFDEEYPEKQRKRITVLFFVTGVIVCFGILLVFRTELLFDFTTVSGTGRTSCNTNINGTCI